MEDKTTEARKLRAHTIIDEEVLMSKAELEDEQNFPEFIQLLQSREKVEPSWLGLGGKIHSEIEGAKKEITQVSQDVESIRLELTEVSKNMQLILAKLGE